MAPIPSLRAIRRRSALPSNKKGKTVNAKYGPRHYHLPPLLLPPPQKSPKPQLPQLKILNILPSINNAKAPLNLNNRKTSVNHHHPRPPHPLPDLPLTVLHPPILDPNTRPNFTLISNLTKLGKGERLFELLVTLDAKRVPYLRTFSELAPTCKPAPIVPSLPEELP